MLHLPPDTVHCILRFLTPHEVGRLSQTCTALRDECTKEIVWKNFARALLASYFPCGEKLYEADRQECWLARRARRQARQEASRAQALATIQRWRLAGSSEPASGAAAPAGGAAEEGGAAGGADSGSDTELDALDAVEGGAFQRRLQAAGIALPPAEAAAEEEAPLPRPPPTLAAQAAQQQRRALRAACQAAAAHATALRTHCLEEFRAARARLRGLTRLAFPGFPVVRMQERGVYAMRCWYIRKGEESSIFHPTPEGGMKCVYHRALLLRPDGTALYACVPGELPEALRHFARVVSGSSSGMGGGSGSGASSSSGSGSASLAAWGPPPQAAGLGAPCAPREALPARVCRGAQEGGMQQRALRAAEPAEAGEAAGAAAAAAAPRRGLPRAERGDHTLGRGVWQAEGRSVSVAYVTGGHNILSRLLLHLSSEMVQEEGGGVRADALYAEWSGTLTVEQMLVGPVGGPEGEMTVMEQLRGQRFSYYELTAGVQGLP